MPSETDLHKTLKKEACRWLFRMGYRCIAAEVRLHPVGIIDAVGSGLFRAYHNDLALPRELPQACFVESAIARTLTGDIHRADARAMNSVNREIFAQQAKLAERIRAVRPGVVLSPVAFGPRMGTNITREPQIIRRETSAADQRG